MVQNNNISVDSCEFSGNGGGGLTFSEGVALVTNSFFTRNVGVGVNFSSSSPGSKLDFNTVADNSTFGFQIVQQPATTAITLSNNLVARNTSGAETCSLGNCMFPGAVVIDGTDVTSAHFASAEVPPYDYHLTPGSIAIDAATTATLDHDVDGDVRPLGQGRDVGADEAQ